MMTSPNVIATPTWPSWCVFASTTIAPQPAKTSANVPIASASSWRSSDLGTLRPPRRHEDGEQHGSCGGRNETERPVAEALGDATSCHRPEQVADDPDLRPDDHRRHDPLRLHRLDEHAETV